LTTIPLPFPNIYKAIPERLDSRSPAISGVPESLQKHLAIGYEGVTHNPSILAHQSSLSSLYSIYALICEVNLWS